MPFRLGRRGDMAGSELLEYLSQIPAARELVFRGGQNLNAMRVFERLSESVQNIEAARLQISGVAPYTACTYCREGHGMFNQCVVLPTHDAVRHCANCHMDGNGVGCAFTTSVAGPGAPSGSHSNGPPVPTASFDYDGQSRATVRHEVQPTTSNRREQIHHVQPGRGSYYEPVYPLRTTPSAYETLYDTRSAIRRPQEEPHIRYVYRDVPMGHEMRLGAHHVMRYPQEEPRRVYVYRSFPPGYEARRGTYYSAQYPDDELHDEYVYEVPDGQARR